MIKYIIIVSILHQNPPPLSWGGHLDQSMASSLVNFCSHHCSRYESLAVSAYSRTNSVLKGVLGLEIVLMKDYNQSSVSRRVIASK